MTQEENTKKALTEINSLPKEKPSEDLEKAADNYSRNLDYYHYTSDDPAVAFKAGAEWQKNKMLEGAVDGQGHNYEGGPIIWPKNMHIRTRVHTLQEGWDLCCAIMRKGYEGVQNDSSRYNDIMLDSAFRQNGYCWVGVYGCRLYILNTHDKKGRALLKELGKCKFIEELGLDVRRMKLPKSIQS